MDKMDEMLGGGGANPDAAGDAQSNPRLQAILELLKFLSQSEADRAGPPKAAMPAPGANPDAGGDSGGMSDDDLEALKSMAR